MVGAFCQTRLGFRALSSGDKSQSYLGASNVWYFRTREAKHTAFQPYSFATSTLKSFQFDASSISRTLFHITLDILGWLEDNFHLNRSVRVPPWSNLTCRNSVLYSARSTARAGQSPEESEYHRSVLIFFMPNAY